MVLESQPGSGYCAGHEDYEVEGNIEYFGEDLLELDVDERACEGIFLAFQYPVNCQELTTLIS